MLSLSKNHRKLPQCRENSAVNTIAGHCLLHSCTVLHCVPKKHPRHFRL